MTAFPKVLGTVYDTTIDWLAVFQFGGTLLNEGVGKVTNDRNLKAEWKAEKKEGKVQQKIGHAKEAVADLKGKLAELKTR